jgi:hypothetical protein
MIVTAGIFDERDVMEALGYRHSRGIRASPAE